MTFSGDDFIEHLEHLLCLMFAAVPRCCRMTGGGKLAAQTGVRGKAPKGLGQCIRILSRNV